MAKIEGPLIVYLSLAVFGLLRIVLDHVFSDALFRTERGGRPSVHVQPMFSGGRHGWMKPTGLALVLAVTAVVLIQDPEGFALCGGAALLGLMSGNLLGGALDDLHRLRLRLAKLEKKSGPLDAPATAWVSLSFLVLALAWSILRVTAVIPVWNALWSW